VAGNPRLGAIEAGLREEAFVIVVLTRLSLVMPFNLLNYAYGITSVRGSVHFIATGVGMLAPVALYVYLGTLARALYVYLGTLARDIGQILSGAATPTTLGYWIAGAGIIAIIINSVRRGDTDNAWLLDCRRRNYCDNHTDLGNASCCNSGAGATPPDHGI
jgi:uncharacterized membrane protein YdjX (TVP38/TMEM64 family)